jgi:metal-responsive CopG/Arc/MetJ family transcriptional regulator
MPKRRPIQQSRQTMVWLSEDDYALLEYIRAQTGLRARVEAIRFAIRNYARQLRAEEARTMRDLRDGG